MPDAPEEITLEAHVSLMVKVAVEGGLVSLQFVASVCFTHVSQFQVPSFGDVKREILFRYDVRYVIVGDVERNTLYGGEAYASSAGLTALEHMVGSTLEVAFQTGSTTVYRVISPG